jgi:hypothetical protein
MTLQNAFRVQQGQIQLDQNAHSAEPSVWLNEFTEGVQVRRGQNEQVSQGQVRVKRELQVKLSHRTTRTLTDIYG